MNKEAADSNIQAEIPINRIRVETALSRFPVHRLVKKGTITIDLQRSSDGIQADFRWKVSYNSDFGQPGPLAYKVDTLIVNRRIDEAGRPLPEIIKLGSLTGICAELGIGDGGLNLPDVKRAFYQNASAFITAKIRYKTKTGRERWGEIGYTRYAVVFTGETLPDGRTADAVYIVINPSYRELLNHVEVRPLDYDYLMQLAPGAQRFYELLSFQVYGAIASGRPRAKMLYSEYCKYAPQVRYPDFDHVKKQMYKVHVPHRESGYVLKVEYEETVDGEGDADWLMLYTPGPKAMVEYNAFTNRQTRQQSSTVPALSSNLPHQPKNHQQPVQTILDLLEGNPTLSELTRRGITDKKACELVTNLKPGQELMDQLEYLDQLIAQAPRGKFHNPSGFYVKFIENNAPIPDTFWGSRKQRLHDEAEHAKNAERSRQAQLAIDYEEYQTVEVKQFISDRLPVQEYDRMFEQCRQDNRRRFKNMTAAQLDELTRTSVCAEVKQSGRVTMLSFEEFCSQNAGLFQNA
ncbi:MAG: hypothetical protein M3Z35_00395 [Nitrospirota bacterium]|nr:hypothetical protein [Nitrospirota bacterium]